MYTITYTETKRTLTRDQATQLIGDKVQPAKPNVHNPTVFTHNNEPILAYLPIPNKTQLRQAVIGIDYSPTPRASGMNSMSRTFGASPRRPVYGREGCHQSSIMNENPEAGKTLSNWATNLENMLRTFAPHIANNNKQILEAVKTDWRMGENSLWTSGVINKSSRLPYHRDSFNFPTWSAMPVLRRNMQGGYLSIPEYNLTLACRDGYAVFFPGHELVHGVTPMQPTAPDGYRYSIVYYALKGMKDCFTHAIETEYAKNKRTEREREMARKIANGETLRPISPIIARQYKTQEEARKAIEEETIEIDPHQEAMDARESSHL